MAYSDYWSMVRSSCADSKTLWRKLKLLLEPTAASTGPHSANDFADYFTGKFERIRATNAGAPLPTMHTRSVPPLNGFDGPTLEEVTKAIQKAPCKQCDIDPVPTWLVKMFVDQLGPTITAMIGLSFTQGYFHINMRLYDHA